jgi:small-conductance mechanosensitive channel
LEEKVTEILAALQGSVTELAPEAWAALVFAARVDSVLSLIGSIAILAGCAVFLRKWPKLWERSREDDLEPAVVIASFLVGILAIVAIITIFSTYVWLGLFYPEAAVIRSILDGATS